ncbi:MAG: tetratricopeptide repeat protein [Caulobacterales bacterium]
MGFRSKRSAATLDEASADGSLERLLNAGLASHRAGELAAAQALFRQALDVRADDPTALYLLALNRFEAGEVEEAARLLERVARLRPDHAHAQFTLAELNRARGQHAAAIAGYRRTLELDPSHAGAWIGLGRLGGDGRAQPAAEVARNLLVISAAPSAPRVLVLSTTAGANIPDRYLLPTSRYSRLIWHVGYATEAQMRTLPPFDVVFNAIGDQDLAGPTAANVARFVSLCPARVFNHPARIERTRRHQTAELLASVADIVTPRTARVLAAELAEHGALGAARRTGLKPPLLLRGVGSHGGEGLKLIEDAEVASDDLPATPAAYLSEFSDFRSADGLYRKYRMIFVDRRPFPYHLAIKAGWMVHYETSGMDEHPERLAEERRFLEDPEAAIGRRAIAAITAIGERLDLDFGGVDFSVLTDGRVLVFEANATMLVHPEDPGGPLAHKNPYVQQILEAFWAMLEGSPARR